MAGRPHKTSLWERFYAKVRKTDSCWIWVGAKQTPRVSQPIGYGVMITRPKPRFAMLAHRLSWWLHRGPIPEGMGVLHHCDNPPCVNPEHLFLGTQIENMKDCAAKGRKKRGEQHGRAKLTENQVIEIKKRLKQGESILGVARSYGKRHGTIWAISVGRSWKHVIV